MEYTLHNNISNMHPICISCIVQQAYRFTNMAEITDRNIQKRIMYQILDKLLVHKDIKTAAHFSVILQSIVGEHTNVAESLRKLKANNLCQAMKYVNYITQIIDGAPDKLEFAIRAAIAGNTIDLGANPDFNIENEINRITSNNIDLEVIHKFRDEYEQADTILIIGDNYEEALFDKLLIMQLIPKNVIYAVRSAQIMNDITMEDAIYLGLNKLCKVVESGSTITGIDLELCTDEFLKIYNTADIVIAKGQGNYETLLWANRPIYFMFKVKCDVIAEMCGHPIGTSMIYRHHGSDH
jgi:damage-control phosphatase, subfamily I